jgi:hypothetical protein
MNFGSKARVEWLLAHSCERCGNLGRDECTDECREDRRAGEDDRADERAREFAPFDWRPSR